MRIRTIHQNSIHSLPAQQISDLRSVERYFHSKNSAADESTVDADDRIHRREVYDHSYQCSAQEKKELTNLAIDMGFLEGNGTLTSKNFSADDKTMRKLFSCDPHYYPQSIILKRGRIHRHNKLDHELILLTHGFILARMMKPYHTVDGTLVCPLIYEHSKLYADVQYIEDLFSEESSNKAIVIEESSTHLDFTCGDGVDERDAWWDALSIVMRENRLHSNKRKVAGWEQRVIRDSDEKGTFFRRLLAGLASELDRDN